MIILALDFETTGTDVNNDHAIEVGAVLYSTAQKKCLESAGFLVKTNKPITEEITNLTNIHPAAVSRFGYEQRAAIENLDAMIQMADAWVGHNVLRFDSKILKSTVEREHYAMRDKLWIDTMYDLPACSMCRGSLYDAKHLGYMAADHGFLNMFPHSALADCQTVLKLIGMHDFDQTVARAQSPFVVLQAYQKRNENDLAKKQKFRWNPDYKIWWKAVRQVDVDTVAKDCKFDVAVASPEVLLEKLWAE